MAGFPEHAELAAKVHIDLYVYHDVSEIIACGEYTKEPGCLNGIRFMISCSSFCRPVGEGFRWFHTAPERVPLKNWKSNSGSGSLPTAGSVYQQGGAAVSGCPSRLRSQ